nr:MAG TPA: hypothetical protein [Caudoviricetes sp.]
MADRKLSIGARSERSHARAFALSHAVRAVTPLVCPYPHVHTPAGHLYALARYPSNCFSLSIKMSLAFIINPFIFTLLLFYPFTFLLFTYNHQFSSFHIKIYVHALASFCSRISPVRSRVRIRFSLYSVSRSLGSFSHSIGRSLIVLGNSIGSLLLHVGNSSICLLLNISNSVRCLLRNISKRSVRLLSHFGNGSGRSLFCIARGIISSCNSQFSSVISRFLRLGSSSVRNSLRLGSCSISRALSIRSSLVSLISRNISSIRCRIGLLDSLVCPRYQVAKFHGRRQHHNSCVHLNRVLTLMWFKHRITLGIVVNKHYLLIFVASPRTAEQLALHLKRICTQSHLRALHSHLKQRVVLHAYRMRHSSTAESIDKIHLHLLASRQRKLLHLSAHNLPYRHSHRKIVTSYYLFHIDLF